MMFVSGYVYSFNLAIKHSLPIEPLLLPYVSVSLPCCSSLQGRWNIKLQRVIIVDNNIYHIVTNDYSMQVTLPDFFLGDQLTSQVQALRSIQFYICYYGWGDFKQRQDTCKDWQEYKIFLYIVAVIPYLSRLLQVQERNHLKIA